MTIGRAWAAALALLLGSCTAAEQADPALWVVRDADTTVYLFGSLHVLPPGLAWFDAEVKAAFDRSDTLVLEIVRPGAEEMRALAAELGTRHGPPLSATLTPAERERMAALGVPASAIDGHEPWLAATELVAIETGRLGLTPADGVEAVLSTAAAASGKPVEALETAREQLALLDALPDQEQRLLLAHALSGDARARLGPMVEQWKSGDAEALGRTMSAELAGSPMLARTLLFDRNRHWAQWIARRLERPGTVFVAVGALHLAGRGSVQAELARRGYAVKRVHY